MSASRLINTWDSRLKRAFFTTCNFQTNAKSTNAHILFLNKALDHRVCKLLNINIDSSVFELTHQFTHLICNCDENNTVKNEITANIISQIVLTLTLAWI